MNEPADDYQLLALDVGRRRIGVARAHSQVRLVEPLAILPADGGEFAALAEIFATWSPALLIIGLPFNSRGEEGEQAAWIRDWVGEMVAKTEFAGRIAYQDETLSTKAAVEAGGKGFVDDLAASIILEDYLERETKTDRKGVAE